MITDKWRGIAIPDGEIDYRGYTLCVLDRLRSALRRRDVFVPAADRWGDPRRLLLDGPAWTTHRAPVLASLGLDGGAPAYLDVLGTELETAYRHAIDIVAGDPAVSIATDEDRDRVHLARLDEVPEPATATVLRRELHELLPEVDLPEILLEVDAWTGFTDEFLNTNRRAHIRDLPLSICAALLAQACNIGYAPVTRRDIPALTAGRLDWVTATHLTPAAIAAANARFVARQTRIGVVNAWGQGEVAAADGMRFLVPVRSAHAGANPHYFGTGRGVTYYNWSSDQYTSFHAIVIPGTLRDSQFILDGLLENTTLLEPHEITADTAADSDLVHGLFRLLGYQFSPRLADLPDRRYWRLDPTADYGPFNRLAAHRINRRLIEDHWDDITRAAGTLHTRAATASQLIRALQRGGQPSPLGRAIGELGRIVKTITMLTYISDDAYRRRILVMLNRQEARHSLARHVFHGRRGDLHQAYKTGQEQQLGALGLVVNAIALYNTRYLDRAVTHLRQQDHQIHDDDLRHVSPLAFEHINVHGRYAFNLPDTIGDDDLRPLPAST